MTKIEFLDGDKWVEVKGAGITRSPRVNVGTIGHIDFGKTALSSAVRSALHQSRGNKSDRKRNRRSRWR